MASTPKLPTADDDFGFQMTRSGPSRRALRRIMARQERSALLSGHWGEWIRIATPEAAAQAGWVREVRSVYKNDLYMVMCRPLITPLGKMVHLAITTPAHLEPPWRDKQRIKDEICGPDCVAIEVMPAADDVIDGADMYHMWVMPKGVALPFGLHLHGEGAAPVAQAAGARAAVNAAASLGDSTTATVLRAVNGDINLLFRALRDSSSDLFPGLTWSTRPDMSGSEAPDALIRVWVATAMAIQELHGALQAGACMLMNLAALPLVQKVLGEPAAACAGYARFASGSWRMEYGLRWRPQKWRPYLDQAAADRAAALEPLQDVHCWIETRTHVVDLSTFQIAARGRAADVDSPAAALAVWPPMIYWPKSRVAKHPREVRGDRALLLWRKTEALALPSVVLAPVIGAITGCAQNIYDNLAQLRTKDHMSGFDAEPRVDDRMML